MKKMFFLGLALLLACPIFAQLKLAEAFSDHMVLQQGKYVRIWGTANKNQKVFVKFAGQTAIANVGADGKWMLNLKPMKASTKPRQMVVTSGKNKLILSDVLIGEVWLCGGQSNMDYQMRLLPGYEQPYKGENLAQKELDKASAPLVRLMQVEKDMKKDVLPTQGWKPVNKESLSEFSAIGYFFAKYLSDSLQVPVGVIQSSWGGTQIESWTPKEAYRQSKLFSHDIHSNTYRMEDVGDRYERLIHPLMPYTMSGILWYQGENNITENENNLPYYGDKMKILIKSWRKGFENESLPFYFVQLASHAYSQDRNALGLTWHALPDMWMQQRRALELPHTGMVTANDLVDNMRQVHHSYKWVLAERFMRIALNQVYGRKNMEYQGPTAKKATRVGDDLIVEFDHADGLHTSDGKAPSWFTAKCERNHRLQFFKAEGRIEGNKVILRCTNNSKVIKGVGGGWDEISVPNLYNGSGLPMIPFYLDFE